MSLSDDVRAVYFDLDDTLCGYWEASKRALRETFEQHAIEGHDPDTMVREWGNAFRELLPEIKTDRWYPAYLRSGEPTRTEQMRRTLLRLGRDDAAHAALLSKVYADLRNGYLRLFPEVQGVLSELQPRYPLGLITNGPADVQRMEIETLGIGEFFDHIFIEGEMGFGKPVAEVFLRAAAAVNLSPGQVLFVGNSYPHDILPAIEMGWRTVWIRREPNALPNLDARPEPESRPQPDAEVSGLEELLELLRPE